jgi:hypothetical protein
MARRSDLQCLSPARGAQRSRGQERTAPRRFQAANSASHNVARQALHGPPAAVEQSGLAGHAFGVRDDPHQECHIFAGGAGRPARYLGRAPIQVINFPAQAASDRLSRYLCSDNQPAIDDPQAFGEPQ